MIIDDQTNQVAVPLCNGKLDDYQLSAVEKRRNEIISLIVETLSPRRTELYWERRLDMHGVGRCIGHLQAVAELQALLEVNARGLDAREQILNELNQPPFKRFPLPEAWGSPCVDYIRGALFSNSGGYPDLQWPLNGGSTAGV